MITLTITEIVKSPAALKEALSNDSVRIIWKEQKPRGEVVFSAIAEKEGDKKC